MKSIPVTTGKQVENVVKDNVYSALCSVCIQLGIAVCDPKQQHESSCSQTPQQLLTVCIVSMHGTSAEMFDIGLLFCFSLWTSDTAGCIYYP